jgi:hypothetical protein
MREVRIGKRITKRTNALKLSTTDDAEGVLAVSHGEHFDDPYPELRVVRVLCGGELTP